MFEEIRNRQAPSRHVYVQRPAYIITEQELREIEELGEDIKSALEGDSNDAEHDALASVAMTLGIEYRDPEDVLEDEDL